MALFCIWFKSELKNRHVPSKRRELRPAQEMPQRNTRTSEPNRDGHHRGQELPRKKIFRGRHEVPRYSLRHKRGHVRLPMLVVHMQHEKRARSQRQMANHEKPKRRCGKIQTN